MKIFNMDRFVTAAFTVLCFFVFCAKDSFAFPQNMTDVKNNLEAKVQLVEPASLDQVSHVEKKDMGKQEVQKKPEKKVENETKKELEKGDSKEEAKAKENDQKEEKEDKKIDDKEKSKSVKREGKETLQGKIEAVIKASNDKKTENFIAYETAKKMTKSAEKRTIKKFTVKIPEKRSVKIEEKEIQDNNAKIDDDNEETTAARSEEKETTEDAQEEESEESLDEATNEPFAEVTVPIQEKAGNASSTPEIPVYTRHAFWSIGPCILAMMLASF